MWLFDRKKEDIGKKELNSEEYEKLFKRIIDLEQRTNRLELNENSFRDKVLRKLQAHRVTEEPEEEVTEYVYTIGKPMRRK